LNDKQPLDIQKKPITSPPTAKMSAFLRRSVAVPRIAARSFSSTPARGVARITIVGNLADTPELHATSTGREIIKYAVASNSGPRENRQTSWFRVTSFENPGPRRDFLQSLPKGYARSKSNLSYAPQI
jgi:hypothetical protein